MFDSFECILAAQVYFYGSDGQMEFGFVVTDLQPFYEFPCQQLVGVHQIFLIGGSKYIWIDCRVAECGLNGMTPTTYIKMSKDAILFVVDTGCTMDLPFSESSSRLKVALECCKSTLQQKLFNNTTHELGLMIFGDNESDDGNTLVLQEIAKPNIELVRKVELLSNATLGNVKRGGDIFRAIQTAVRKIGSHCGTKKYNKRLFVFTNGAGSTEYTQRDIGQLAGRLQEEGIKVNVITIDFMSKYDVDTNTLEAEIYEETHQEGNAELLLSLTRSPNVQVFPASLAIQLYKKFRKRDTNPVAIFKGDLEIAPGLAIQVSTYKAIRRERMKPLSKYDMSAPFNPEVGKEKEIIQDVSHVVQGDESGAVVPPEQYVNAFNYGPHLVPISDILEKGAKVFEERNFKLLGFVDKHKIPRESFMGEVDIVVPNGEMVSKKLFTSFVYSMISLNRYAICRYVPRTVKNGVCPRMVVLIPNRTTEREMMYLVELPTVEDVRDYPFSSLKKSTEKQREIVRELVGRMMLVEDGREQVKVESTFNPVRQYFYQTVFHRALVDGEALPELNETTREYIRPELRSFANCTPLMPALRKQFKLIKKELPKDKQKEGKTVLWKQMLEETRGEISNEMEEEIPIKTFVLEGEDEERFNPNKPIASLKSLVTNNKRDLVEYALGEMKKYIQERSRRIVETEDLNHVVECCGELRRACVSEKEEQFWDEFLQECRDNTEKLYEAVKREGLGYLKRMNQDIYKPLPNSLHALEIDMADLD